MAPPEPSRADAYWRANVRLCIALLTVWAAVSYGAGILWVDWLDRVHLPGTGFPLGFWFAQQGSIYVFVGLIWAYVFFADRLERDLGRGGE